MRFIYCPYNLTKLKNISKKDLSLVNYWTKYSSTTLVKIGHCKYYKNII